jgi:hypothetical protein
MSEKRERGIMAQQALEIDALNDAGRRWLI